MRSLSFSQVVTVADAICETTGAQIRDYPALAAIAAATNPKLHGVRVHRNTAAQQAAIKRVTLALKPLDSHNDTAAEIFARVAADWSLQSFTPNFTP
ncbi:hypothetical protein [Corynebacterium caspium]|uniref:hypothetical protein n=1 Tax=Corynebacterium caspium TaxID=234828 RepID=UPI000380C971|nr:hypothetical protein [Corynebacterium caspium]WKD58448.1 hypothetical protein CCASP_00045 [Corynebacterium caspium DSM 44850]